MTVGTRDFWNSDAIVPLVLIGAFRHAESLRAFTGRFPGFDCGASFNCERHAERSIATTHPGHTQRGVITRDITADLPAIAPLMGVISPSR